jgi:hypothetical protein
MKSKRRKELATIVAPKAILQKNFVTKRNKIGRTNSKVFHKVALTSKNEFLMIDLSISSICRDAWFVDFGASQHLTFQKEVFSTFK